MEAPSDHPVLQLTLREVFEAFYCPELKSRARPVTILTYRDAIRKWESLTDNPPLGRIDDACLLRYRDKFLAEGLKPSTFNKTWTHIRTILRRLGRQESRNPMGMGILARVPYIRPIPIDLEFPRILTADELDAFYAACEQARCPQSCVPPSEWWRTAVVLTYNCGPRPSDLFGLRLSDVDLKQRRLQFVARKNRRAQTLPINDTVIAHLKSIWSARTYVLPWGQRILKGRPYKSEFRRLQLLAGIREPFGFRTLRRTCASIYAETVGPDVATYMLGHFVQGMTKQHYISPMRLIINAVDNLPQPPSFLVQKRHVVAPPIRRTDWAFGPGWARHRDRTIRLTPRTLAILRSLVTAGRPLTEADLLATAYWDNPDAKVATIRQAVILLRRRLEEAFHLPKTWNPIRWELSGGRGYILVLPADHRTMRSSP